MPPLHLDLLDALEHEAIHIMREAVAQLPRCAILFSGGKDSIVLAAIARKAFAPATAPLTLLHIDTGHNFPETIEFRDWFVHDSGYRLIVRTVQASIDAGRVEEESGPNASRNALQTVTLLDAIAELRLDCTFGGGRRDEEKARAKERIFSHRDRSGRWDPKHQRPELWNLYNGRKNPGEHFRVFPLSNWTELDIWSYISREKLSLPRLYFAHVREVFFRHGTWLAVSPYLTRQPGERVQLEQIRFRTVGDMTCTGAIRSTAGTLEEIVLEVAALRQTERGTRHDDQRSETAMEDRKRQGYF
jgi:sulfate adenylyltransferase subunit 2